MLQTIREHTQGWIAGAIIFLIILSFALWGIHSYFIGGDVNTNVAKVNGVEISKEQLAVAYERMRRQSQLHFNANAPATTKDETELKTRALQSLIDLEVLKQASYAQGFRVSDFQVDSYLQSMPEFQVDGRFSLDRFQEILSSTLLSTSEFLELIRTSLLIDQPKLGIIFTSFSLPEEAHYTIALVNQARNIDYVNIPLSYFLSQSYEIKDQAIQAYYDQHASEFMTPEQVNIEYLALSMRDLFAKINPIEAALKSFYNENINAYTLATRWKFSSLLIPLSGNASQEEVAAAKEKMHAVVDALNKGQAFAEVARAFSGVVTTSGLVTLNEAPTELQKAVAGLTQVGQLSEPFRTSKGWMLVKIIEVQPPKTQSFEAVKDKVKETYVRQRAEERFAELRDQLANLTYEHPESLASAAKELGLTVKTSELFARDKAGKDISQYKKVRETAFSNDVLTLQNNSDVIQLNPETMVVLRVKSHVPSTLLPIKEVAKQIAEKLKAQEANMRAVQFVEGLVVKLRAGENPQQLVSANKFNWVHAGSIGRYSTKVDTAILDLAFRLPDPAHAKEKISYGMTRTPNGYSIVALNAVKEGSISDKRQAAVFAEQVQNSEGLLEYELYKLSQIKNARIKMLQK
ncbi:MAG TPA: SurA N-terminal domain-containing protein [Gammaproteobacteria bacterium]|jgi:peptidyl-prolyl cis-trans isomerase D|nr:SurA N-terminal domain-containing protein [Gammaproteobacteria bacterium]